MTEEEKAPIVPIADHGRAATWSNERGAPPDGHLYVQWKGTNVCADFWCPKCEATGHADAEFMYEIQCPDCGQLYRVSARVGIRAIEDSAKMMSDPVVPE